MQWILETTLRPWQLKLSFFHHSMRQLKSQVKVEELLKTVPVKSKMLTILKIFIQAGKEIPPLPVAGEDPGPVDEPPDEGGCEQQGGDGQDPTPPASSPASHRYFPQDKNVNKTKMLTSINVNNKKT